MKNSLIAAGRKLASRAAHALEHHPKQVTALVALALLGGGGGAFAVANLDPEPETVVVREVVEPVQPLALDAQLQALDLHQFSLFRTEITRATDTADSLLTRLGINDAAAAAFLRKDALFRSQVLGRTGRSITAEASDTHELRKLSARWATGEDGTFKRLVIQRLADGAFSTLVETAPLTAAVRLASGTIHSSLFAAADNARIPDGVVSQVAEVFSSAIDFRQDLRRGDRFSVVYEVLEADGEPIRAGRVLSAEFVNQGKTHQAVWFQPQGHKGGYYTPSGQSLVGSYLASPVEFSRVSSGFAMRFHPILKQFRRHLGVDYAATTGTPVRAIGDGVVHFAGRQNGYGNVVILRHNSTDETLYAHLSRVNVRNGQRVSQGQNIGAVGATGWATGPHLHFEFRANGVQVNPTVIARRSGTKPLAPELRPEFDRVARTMLAQLEAAPAAVVASAE